MEVVSDSNAKRICGGVSEPPGIRTTLIALLVVLIVVVAHSAAAKYTERPIKTVLARALTRADSTHTE